MRTMAQKRAQYALEEVLKATKGKSKDEKDKFKSFSSGAPSMILQNGFGQTLAFWLAKGSKEDDKHSLIFSIVMRWLSFNANDINNTFVKSKDTTALMKEIAEMDQREYLNAQTETLALLEWVKRFAAADLT